MAFNLKSRLSDETVDRLLAILNGTSKEVVTKSEVTHKNGIIYFNEKEVFLIRGWGHLTGCGALNLPSETAARIQDEFAEWVVKRLTGKDQESIDSLKLRDALNVPELDYEKIKGDPLKGGKEDAAE
ncbi:MAG: hypothetical protein RR346_12145 [Bacteroidales bacterium]